MVRPAYRRGRGLRQHSFRVSDEAMVLLRAEAARRHVWVSALVEQAILQALKREVGGRGGATVEEAGSPNPSPARHWCRLAIEVPLWERLHREATRRGMSVAQLIRQHLGAFGSEGSSDSDPFPMVAADAVGPSDSRPGEPRVGTERQRGRREESLPESIPPETMFPTKPLSIFELT